MAGRPLSGDDVFRDLTLAIARRARDTHGSVDGRCEHCRVMAPCPAFLHAEATTATLTQPVRAVGVARVHPAWLAGRDTR